MKTNSTLTLLMALAIVLMALQRCGSEIRKKQLSHPVIPVQTLRQEHARHTTEKENQVALLRQERRLADSLLRQTTARLQQAQATNRQLRHAALQLATAHPVKDTVASPCDSLRSLVMVYAAAEEQAIPVFDTVSQLQKQQVQYADSLATLREQQWQASELIIRQLLAQQETIQQQVRQQAKKIRRQRLGHILKNTVLIAAGGLILLR